MSEPQVVLSQTDRMVSVSVFVPDVGSVAVQVHSNQTERQSWVCRAQADSYASDDRFTLDNRFTDRDDAATEAAEMLFGLTERFMPVAHRELFGEVKPTPEVVLRAMLKAYQDAHIKAAKAFLKARDDYSKQFDLNLTGQAEYRLDVAEEAYLDVLLNLASWTVDETTDFEIEFVDADYRARLAGERPFDAHHEALSFALSKVHARESEEVYNMKQEILDRYQHAGRAEMLLHLDKLTAAVRDGIERPIFDAAYMSKSPSDAIDKWMKEP